MRYMPEKSLGNAAMEDFRNNQFRKNLMPVNVRKTVSLLHDREGFDVIKADNDILRDDTSLRQNPSRR